MESMEEIYQNHSKKVYTFLLSKTCNHELAEELTQETFFSGVVMGKSVIIIVESGTGCISGSCYHRTACATTHNFCF